MYILWSVIVMLAASLFLGLLVVIFAKVFEVKVDPRVEAINAVLPAFNCGGCGYPGCINYAAAIVEQNEHVNKCTPGGPATAEKIKQILMEQHSQESN